MNFAVETAGSFADVFLLLIFLNSFFISRDRNKLVQLVTFVGYGLWLGVLSSIPDFDNPRLFLNFLGFAVLAFVFYECSVWQSAFASVIFCALYMLVDLISIGCMELIGITPAQLCVDPQGNELGPRSLYIITARLMLLLLLMIVKVFSKKQSETVQFKWILPLIPGQLLSVACCIVMLKDILDSNSIITIQNVVFVVTFLYINLVIVAYTELIRTNEARQKQHMLQEQQYVIQQQYYQRLHETQEETRALWHDIKKYLSAIETVQQDKDNQSAPELVKQVNEMVDAVCPVVDVGNNVVSAILDEYRAKAAQIDSKFELDVMVPPAIEISPVDLYVIMGNTLDNAINACKALPKEERWIRVKMRKQNQMLLYQIENAKTNHVSISREGKYHGYGLKNVRRSVDRYDGQMSIQDEEHQYKVTVRVNT